MTSYTDPLTGETILPGTPIVKCRRGHISRADSWEVGNRCHHPGCRYRGSPASTDVLPESIGEIAIIATLDNSNPVSSGLVSGDAVTSSDMSAPSTVTPLSESGPLDIQVLHQSRSTLPWWSTFWSTFLFATVTTLIFGLALVTSRYAELVNTGATSDIISSYLMNDITRWTTLGLGAIFISAVLLTLLRLFWLRR